MLQIGCDYKFNLLTPVPNLKKNKNINFTEPKNSFNLELILKKMKG